MMTLLVARFVDSRSAAAEALAAFLAASFEALACWVVLRLAVLPEMASAGEVSRCLRGEEEAIVPSE